MCGNGTGDDEPEDDAVGQQGGGEPDEDDGDAGGGDEVDEQGHERAQGAKGKHAKDGGGEQGGEDVHGGFSLGHVLRLALNVGRRCDTLCRGARAIHFFAKRQASSACLP